MASDVPSGATDRQPGEAPIHGLIRILERTGHRAYDDGITTTASGVAFFVVLAVFPGISAIVGLYSLFAGPRLGDVLQGALPSAPWRSYPSVQLRR